MNGAEIPEEKTSPSCRWRLIWELRQGASKKKIALTRFDGNRFISIANMVPGKYRLYLSATRNQLKENGGARAKSSEGELLPDPGQSETRKRSRSSEDLDKNAHDDAPRKSNSNSSRSADSSEGTSRGWVLDTKRFISANAKPATGLRNVLKTATFGKLGNHSIVFEWEVLRLGQTHDNLIVYKKEVLQLTDAMTSTFGNLEFEIEQKLEPFQGNLLIQSTSTVRPLAAMAQLYLEVADENEGKMTEHVQVIEKKTPSTDRADQEAKAVSSSLLIFVFLGFCFGIVKTDAALIPVIFGGIALFAPLFN